MLITGVDYIAEYDYGKYDIMLIFFILFLRATAWRLFLKISLTDKPPSTTVKFLAVVIFIMIPPMQCIEHIFVSL